MTSIIVIIKTKLKAKTNLISALRYLRQKEFIEILRVDVIGINWFNMRKRKHQVQMNDG
jgi:hypothetical protein